MAQSTLKTTSEGQKKVVDLFLKLVNQRGFTCNTHQGQTIHFSEKVKKNLLKLLTHMFRDQSKEVFRILYKQVMSAITIYNEPIELDENKQPKMTQSEKQALNEKQVKVTTYGLKVLEEILHKYSCKGQSITEFIHENINELVLLTCLACEQEGALMKNQAQMLFKLLMSEILNNKMALREQFEILYVKCVLKPIISR